MNAMTEFPLIGTQAYPARMAQKLYQAVLLQAVRDLVPRGDVNGTAEKRRFSNEHIVARKWFEDADEDFQMVVTFAGFDPDKVHEAYRSGALLRAAETLRARTRVTLAELQESMRNV